MDRAELRQRLDEAVIAYLIKNPLARFARIHAHIVSQMGAQIDQRQTDRCLQRLRRKGTIIHHGVGWGVPTALAPPRKE